MKQPAVSVVTPFHNTARWLPQCIESVLAQTHANYEYILVDNASTDGGGEIAEAYAKRDERIRVFETERLLPQVENYNFALSLISRDTRYCKIVQADDWLYPQFLGASIELAETQPDIDLVCGFVHWNRTIIPAGLSVDQRVLTGREACRLFFFGGHYLFGSPTAQLWRADVVRSRPRFFDPIAAPLEDADVCFELLEGRSFGFVHQVLCFSRREEGSMLDEITGFGWPQAHRLVILLRWGRKYLSEAEYAAIYKDWWHEYRMILAGAKVRGASAEFHAFHRRMMAAAKMEHAGKNLFLPVLAWYLDRIGNPKQTCENLLRRLRNRHGRGSARDG